MTNKKFPFEKAQDIDFMDPIVQENWFDAYDLIRKSSVFYASDWNVCAHSICRYRACLKKS